MKRSILITGIAGSGKSAVAKQFNAMRHEAYGIEDIDGMFAMYKKGANELYTDFDNSDPIKIKNSEWRCNKQKLEELISQQKNAVAFYCGVASNMDDIMPLFEKVILLKATPKVVRDRLSTREGTDNMGSTEASRDAVLDWKDWWEDQMIKKGVIVIDAERDQKMIAKEIVKITQT